MFDPATQREFRATRRARSGFRPFLPLVLLLGALALLQGVSALRPAAVPALLRSRRLPLVMSYLILAGMVGSALIHLKREVD